MPTATRILVVEDEEVVGRLVCRACDDAGFPCHAVTRGAEALAWLSSQSRAVEVAIVDVVLPDMKGADLARSLVTRYPGTRVIFISAHPRHQENPPDPALGPFLPKPFSVDELMFTISQALPPAPQT
jgi:two-component system, cell cycle sensor histidine kinase and response regulator CckA